MRSEAAKQEDVKPSIETISTELKVARFDLGSMIAKVLAEILGLKAQVHRECSDMRHRLEKLESRYKY